MEGLGEPGVTKRIYLFIYRRSPTLVSHNLFLILVEVTSSLISKLPAISTVNEVLVGIYALTTKDLLL